MVDQINPNFATNIYHDIQARVVNNQANTVEEANKFHKMVANNMDKFSKMTPDEVAHYISTGTNAVAREKAVSPAPVISGFRKKLESSEQTTRRSVVNEAPLTEVLANSMKAANNVEVLTKIRDKILEAYDKIISMNI